MDIGEGSGSPRRPAAASSATSGDRLLCLSLSFLV